MLIEKDIIILSHLRKNARQPLTNISRETGIPVTTIYDKIKVHEKTIIKKHTTLIDFSKLGYHTTANIAIKVHSNDKERIEQFILEHPNTNSFYRINYGYDYLIEVIFRNTKEAHSFADELERNFKILEKHIFFVVDELKKEEFLTKEDK